MKKKNVTFYANGQLEGVPTVAGLETAYVDRIKVFTKGKKGLVETWQYLKVIYDYSTMRPFTQVWTTRPVVNGKKVDFTEVKYEHSDKLYQSEEIQGLSREAFYELLGKKIKEDDLKAKFGRKTYNMKGLQSLNFK